MADPDTQALSPAPAGRITLGIYLVSSIVLLAYLLACLWPLVMRPCEPLANCPPVPAPHFLFFGRDFGEMTSELALLWAVGVLGALGGTLHAVGSFVNYIGNRTFVRSWTWFYLARGPVGFGLALLLYFALRGGLFNVSNGSSAAVNPYGFGALAALTGLFSEIATLKLREIFTAMFRPEEQRKDPLSDAAPTITSIAPPSAPSGTNAGDLAIVLHGTDFVDGDTVTIDGKESVTRFVSATRLEATVPAAKLTVAGEIQIAVRRSGPKGVTSKAVAFEVK